MKKSLWVVLFLSLGVIAYSQHGLDTDRNPDLVQFSGLILTDNKGVLEPVPYATVSVKGQGRGTYSNFEGFFSIVVNKKDIIRFSAVGFGVVEFELPDTLNQNRYSVVQMLSVDAVNLPITVIFPWPDREHFKLEFLAMDIGSDLEDLAKENLMEERLAMVSKRTPMDGRENASHFLRQEAQSFYHIGQRPPMNIFNPVAWGKFFQAWKDGSFKSRER